MSKVDETRLKEIEVAMAWNGNPSDATAWARSLTQSDVTDLSGALREAWADNEQLRAQVALLTEALQQIADWCNEPPWNSVAADALKAAALAATAGTERAGRVQKLEALAECSEQVLITYNWLISRNHLVHADLRAAVEAVGKALRDLDAEAEGGKE